MKSCALLVAVLALAPFHVSAQRVRTAIVPERITVGDRFDAAVRVEVSPGVRVTFPDTLDVPDQVEAAARREIHVDTTTTGTLMYTAVYRLTAWKTGAIDLPAATVRIEMRDTTPEVTATFARFVVASVLPPDSSQVEPKPAKDVLGPSRMLWPMIVGALILAALLIAAFVYWRRRRPEATIGPATPPRDIALAELEKIRRLGYLERGEWKLFYSAVSGVLRRYAAALEPGWSRNLTTPELGSAMDWRISSHARADDEVHTGADRLIALLGNADLVKFAAQRPQRADAEAAWLESLGWIEGFAWPPPPEPEPEPAEVSGEAT